MSKPQNDIQTLYAEIEKFANKFYLNRLLKGSILSLGVFSVSYLFFSSLAYFFELSSWIRLFFLLAFVALNVTVFVRLVFIPLAQRFGWMKRMSQLEAAQLIGSMFSDIADRLTNT